ncbi:hypothetical protein AMATHDRAFT_156130, partial [Amanita thiersii Skay4041]
PSVLFVFTSLNKILTSSQTVGRFLPETAHPYYILVPHAIIEFIAAGGPSPPFFEKGIDFGSDPNSSLFLENIKTKLANTQKLIVANAQNYDAIYYVVGHSPAIDLYKDSANTKLVTQVGNPVLFAMDLCGLYSFASYSLCHLIPFHTLLEIPSGESIISGRTLPAFSNREEEMSDDVLFSLEGKISELGGKYEKTAEPRDVIVVDGNEIIGHDPASSVPIAEEMLKALQKLWLGYSKQWNLPDCV